MMCSTYKVNDRAFNDLDKAVDYIKALRYTANTTLYMWDYKQNQYEEIIKVKRRDNKTYFIYAPSCMFNSSWHELDLIVKDVYDPEYIKELEKELKKDYSKFSVFVHII